MLSQNYRLVRTNRRLLIVSSERSSIVRKRGNSSDVCGTRSTRRQPIRKIMEHHHRGSHWCVYSQFKIYILTYIFYANSDAMSITQIASLVYFQ